MTMANSGVQGGQMADNAPKYESEILIERAICSHTVDKWKKERRKGSGS